MEKMEDISCIVNFDGDIRCIEGKCRCSLLDFEKAVAHEFGLQKSFHLLQDGVIIHEFPLNHSVVFVKLAGCVRGGKGGFGALLRAMSKKKGARTTKDFGACRDLSGRRIRNVNDEQILMKWKEAKDKGEDFDTEQTTPSGIDLWFLSTPSWAEGFKKRRRNRARKTRLCQDWVQARENSSPPVGSPVWWGCPRGSRCEFAHGEEELQGASGSESTAAEQAAAQDEKRSYTEAATDNYDQEDVDALISSGLKAQKRKRESIADDLPSTDSSSDFVTCINGQAECRNMTILGVSEFCSVVIKPDQRVPVGDWYFEVKLLTNGILQIGWCTSSFLNSKSRPSDSEEDGIGDDSESWGFDGHRMQKWHQEGTSYGLPLLNSSDASSDEESSCWAVGDIVGSRIQISRNEDGTSSSVKMFFSLNGVNLGEAFAFQLSSNVELFPALSMMEGEEVIIGLDNTSHLPGGCINLMEAYYPTIVPQLLEGNKGVVAEENVKTEYDASMDINELEALSSETLKNELDRRGLKSGGTHKQRAERLFAVRNLDWDHIDKKYKQKKK